jgi:putative transposase
MRGPQPPAIILSPTERFALETLVRGHTTPQQLALRARIVLHAAEGANNEQIARALSISVVTARCWRSRWLMFPMANLEDVPVAERLADAPRPGAPATLTPEQVCSIVALACEAPTLSDRPISHWTGREIAEAIKARGIVETISSRHAARLLKKKISGRI